MTIRHTELLEPRVLLTGIRLANTPIPIVTSSGASFTPSTASEQLAGNKIVVVYGKSNEVFGKIINPDNTSSAEVMLSSPTLDGRVNRFSQFALAATPDGTGFYLAYPADNGNNDFGDIFFAKFDASLNRTLDPVAIGGGATGVQSNPKLKLADNKICLAYEDRPDTFSQNVFVNIAFPDPVTGQLPVQPVRLTRTVPGGFGAGGILDRSIQLNFVNNNFQVAVLRQTLTAGFAFESQQHVGQSVSPAGVFGNLNTIYSAPDNNRTLGVPIIVVTPAGMIDLFSETFFNPANLFDYQTSQVQSLFLGMDLAPDSAKATLDSAASPAQVGISAGFFATDPGTGKGYVVGLESAGTHDASAGLKPADLNSLLINYESAAAPTVTENFVTNISRDVTAFPRGFGGSALIYIPTPGTSTTDVAGFPATVDFPIFSLPTVTIEKVLPAVAVVEGLSLATAEYKVSLSEPATGPVSVRVRTRDPVGVTTNIATPIVDYTPIDEVINFAVGESFKTFVVILPDDSIPEPTKSVDLFLSDPQNAFLGSPSVVVVAITDNDPDPTISIVPVDGQSFLEGDANFPGLARFTLQLSGPSAFPISVRFQTGAPATSTPAAAPGTDYIPVDETVNFAPGEVAKEVIVGFVGDSLAEATEFFGVRLSEPVSVRLAPGASALDQQIVDDDRLITPVISIAEVDGQSHLEGSAAAPGFLDYTVTLSEPSNLSVSVNVATSPVPGFPPDAAAQAGTDYTALTQVLTFNPGETSKTVRVNFIGDSTLELNESFQVSLSAPVNSTLNPAKTTVRSDIFNDDTPSTPFFRIISITPTRLGKGRVKAAIEVKNVGGAFLQSTVACEVRVSTDQQFGADDLLFGTQSQKLSLDPGESATLLVNGFEFLTAAQLANPTTIRFAAKINVLETSQIDANVSASTYAPTTTVTKSDSVKLVDPADRSLIGLFSTKSGTAQITADANGKISVNLSAGADFSLTPGKGKNLPIANLTGDGIIRNVSAPSTDITGNINLPGGVSNLNIKSLKDQHTLTIGGPANLPASITIGQVANTTLTSTQPIKLLRVSEWLDTDATPDLITAPSIDFLTSTGNFQSGLQVTGNVKTISIGATLGGTTVHSLRAASFGTVTVQSIQNTNLYANISSPSRPTTAADFLPGGSITAFIMKGTGYTNSNIAARKLGTLALTGVTTSNDTPFGIAALSITSYSRDKKKSPPKTTPGDLERLNQFSTTLIAP